MLNKHYGISIIAHDYSQEYTNIYNCVKMCLYCNACYWDEERLKNVIYLFIKFLMVKTDQLNVASQNVAVDKNVTMVLNEDLLY
jgi:hypothetical protein